MRAARLMSLPCVLSGWICLVLMCPLGAAVGQTNPASDALAASVSMPASAPATTPASPTEADALAAADLKRSAMALVYASSRVPGRAGRLVALTQYADRLVPQDPQTNWLLANICESQDKLSQAAAALEICLKADGDNFSLGLRWLRAAVGAINNADGRLKFLSDVTARRDLPAALRAQAASMSARILHNQQQDAMAMQAFQQALQLDPFNRDALEGRLALQDKPSQLDRVATMLDLIRGCPTYMTAAWELAQTLDSLGLYEQSMVFYDYCWALVQFRGQDANDEETQAFLAQYFSAALDGASALDDPAARKQAADKAIKTFEPLVAKYPRNVDLQSAMIEAYRISGQADKADTILASLKALYKDRAEQATPVSPGLAAELAWFYLVSLNQPKDALAYARQAIESDKDNLVFQRILGCAELLGEQADAREEGRKALTSLANKDAYAAAFLVEYYARANDVANARQVVQAVGDVARCGPGWRRLVQAARSAETALPSPTSQGDTDSPAIEKLLKDFNGAYLELAKAPEKFLAVAISPVNAQTNGRQFSLGQPVQVEVTLTNIGQLPVPLGDGGLVAPVVGLQASQVITPSPTSAEAATYANLPLAMLPAPRYLQPGQTVKCVVDLNVGDLAGPLAGNPLSDVTFNITGMVDPIQRGQSFHSSLPSLPVKPATVTRAGLLSDVAAAHPEQLAAAYKRALGTIAQEDIVRGQLPQRLRACRQVASLLAYARLVEQGKAQLLKPLETEFTKPPLLAMFNALLNDRSPVVRAEALAAMEIEPTLDEAVLALVGAAIGDRSSLVRLRAAELLGVASLSGNKDQAPVLKHLAQDADGLVALMARTFLPVK